MDHLKGQERRDRWYAKHVSPLYIPIEPATTWDELLWRANDDGTEQQQEEEREKDKKKNITVKSLPFEWLRHRDNDSFLCNDDTNNKDGDNSNNNNDKVSLSIRKILDHQGFLVVSGVLDQRECDEAMDAAWDWIEAVSDAEYHLQNNSSSNNKDDRGGCCSTETTTSITPSPSPPLLPLPPVRRDDMSTLDSIYFPRSVEGGMMPFYGSGHSKFAWLIRSNPKVKRVFEALHGSNQTSSLLLSSLDGIVLWRKDSKFRTDPGWFHLDQNPRYKPKKLTSGIQGLVNLLHTNTKTGGNVIVSQSHKLFPHHYYSTTTSQQQQQQHHACSDFYHQRIEELGDEDWMEIDPNDTIILGDQSKVICCMLGPGDMIVWDSRTVHCSYPSLLEASETRVYNDDGGGGGGLLRAATVVSMMPAAMTNNTNNTNNGGGISISKAVLEARKSAVDQSRTLTHWIDKVAPLGEEHLDHVKREKDCVAMMKERSLARRVPCPLLGWEDLTIDQRRLVVGNYYTKTSET